jgi:hypothetical protein
MTGNIFNQNIGGLPAPQDSRVPVEDRSQLIKEEQDLVNARSQANESVRTTQSMLTLAEGLARSGFKMWEDRTINSFVGGAANEREAVAVLKAQGSSISGDIDSLTEIKQAVDIGKLTPQQGRQRALMLYREAKQRSPLFKKALDASFNKFFGGAGTGSGAGTTSALRGLFSPTPEEEAQVDWEKSVYDRMKLSGEDFATAADVVYKMAETERAKSQYELIAKQQGVNANTFRNLAGVNITQFDSFASTGVSAMIADQRAGVPITSATLNVAQNQIDQAYAGLKVAIRQYSAAAGTNIKEETRDKALAEAEKSYNMWTASLAAINTDQQIVTEMERHYDSSMMNTVYETVPHLVYIRKAFGEENASAFFEVHGNENRLNMFYERYPVLKNNMPQGDWAKAVARGYAHALGMPPAPGDPGDQPDVGLPEVDALGTNYILEGMNEEDRANSIMGEVKETNLYSLTKFDPISIRLHRNDSMKRQVTSNELYMSKVEPLLNGVKANVVEDISFRTNGKNISNKSKDFRIITHTGWDPKNPDDTFTDPRPNVGEVPIPASKTLSNLVGGIKIKDKGSEISPATEQLINEHFKTLVYYVDSYAPGVSKAEQLSMATNLLMDAFPFLFNSDNIGTEIINNEKPSGDIE